MQAEFASCCVLSYNRPEFIKDSLLTLTGNANYPLELIVHDDGSTAAVRGYLEQLVDEGVISSLVLNPPGHNQGVGESMRRMFAIAQGDPIIKLDQDLVYMPGWLEKVVAVLRRNTMRHSPHLDNPIEEEARIGALGLFKYHHPPVHHAEMFKTRHYDWDEVQDFVGSAIAVPRDVYEEYGPFETHSDAFAEDVAFKTKLQFHGLALGITQEDLVVNQGFGLGPSTVAVDDGEGNPTSAEINHGPKIWEAK